MPLTFGFPHPSRVIDLPSGFVFVIERGGHDAGGNTRVDGTMFDTARGVVETGVWFTGPSYMEPATVARVVATAMITETAEVLRRAA